MAAKVRKFSSLQKPNQASFEEQLMLKQINEDATGVNVRQEDPGDEARAAEAMPLAIQQGNLNDNDVFADNMEADDVRANLEVAQDAVAQPEAEAEAHSSGGESLDDDDIDRLMAEGCAFEEDTPSERRAVEDRTMQAGEVSRSLFRLAKTDAAFVFGGVLGK